MMHVSIMYHNSVNKACLIDQPFFIWQFKIIPVVGEVVCKKFYLDKLVCPS